MDDPAAREVAAGLDVAALAAAVQRAAAELGVRDGRLSVRLLDDDAMTALHEQFCGIAEPTDVLTFNWLEDEDDVGVDEVDEGADDIDEVFPGERDEDAVTSGEPGFVDDVDADACLDADLAIGLGVAAREATARGHDVFREVMLYIVHGMLHCLGHDDHDDADSERMHAREDVVLTAIGFGPTFASGVDDAPGDDDEAPPEGPP